jgi:hypothetical protein
MSKEAGKPGNEAKKLITVFRDAKGDDAVLRLGNASIIGVEEALCRDVHATLGFGGLLCR